MGERTDLSEERPVFIMGAKRGGTTLLRRIVDAHSQISIPPPGWFYHFVYPYLYAYGDLSKDDNILELIRDCLDLPIVRQYWHVTATPEQILDRLPEWSFRGVFATLSKIYAAEKHASFWGSKAPGDVFWIREIQKDFPNARFVFIYRDGRDVSIDLKEVNWGPNNLYSACLVWKRHMESILRSKREFQKAAYHEVYYEQLVQDPEKIVPKIFEFLEVDYEPGVLNYHLNATDGFMTSSAYHAKTNAPITDTYLGLFRKLPLWQRRLQIAAIGDLLKELGYAVEDDPREVGFWERLRFAEEDDHGGLVLKGGVELMHRLKLRRERKQLQGIWSAADHEKFVDDTS